MWIWVLIVFLTLGGLALMCCGIALWKGDDRFGGIVGILGGLVVAILGLYPLYGDFYTCEYVHVGDGYYIEKCETWEP